MMREQNFVNANILKLGMIVLFTFVLACVEPYEPQTETFESILIVEGVLTDEFKNQEFTLSKSYRLEEDTIHYLDDALLEVVSDDGETFSFRNNGNGNYTSIQPFQAQGNRSYHLEIQTSDGSLYTSDEEKLVGHSELEDLYAERIENEAGQSGVGIFASKVLSGETNYYLYNYEETYKIVSPYKRTYKIVPDEGTEFHFERVTEEREICYNTLKSQKSVLSNTANFNNQNDEALITFLERDDKRILHRYSILVNQKLISKEAYNFYKTLQDLSGSSNVFSQHQPGFISGNISAVNNKEEHVIGYFAVASVSQKRIFFNFRDYFSIGERPDPKDDCYLERPPLDQINGYVRSNILQFLEEAPPDPGPGRGPYYLINMECIDCRVLGTNVKPEFWIEDEN